MENEEQNYLAQVDPYLVSPKAFHLEMPLYHELDLSNGTVLENVFDLMAYSGTIDAYCIWCDKESVFDTTQHLNLDDLPGYQKYQRLEYWKKGHKDGFSRITHRCSRDANHQYYIYYFKEGDLFLKIGQWPSTADFQIPQAEKYRKLLTEEQYKEFTRGIGLAAHGVGIGSFVYMRRIFEDLIEDAHMQTQSAQKDFPNDAYAKAKMDERIQLVKDFLPRFLAENRKLYAILSKGIHDLSEEECLQYFEAVKVGIEQILDEKIIQKEKAEKAAKAREAIQKVHGEITNEHKKQ